MSAGARPAGRGRWSGRRLLFGWAEDRLAGTIDRRVRLAVARRVAELGTRLEATDSHLERTDRELRSRPDAAAVLEVVRREVAEQAEADRPDQAQLDRDFTAGVLLGAGRARDRTLSAELVVGLLAEVEALTGVHGADLALQRAYRSLLDHESRGLGRVAGTTANILGKLMVPPLLRPPAGPVLEIGTLFGLFSSALVRQLQHAGEFRELTVVDPFVGTQVQDGRPGRRDRTGTPVTEQVARRNLTQLGLREDEVRLVCGYSEDEEVRRVAADRSYAIVVVDGDHAADGVHRDLRWVEQVVLPGAIVVVDDWGDPRWSGVEAGGRRYLTDGGRLELLGQVATSAYLRAP